MLPTAPGPNVLGQALACSGATTESIQHAILREVEVVQHDGSCGLRSLNQKKLMDYRYVVRVLVVEDLRLWQEFVAKELHERPSLRRNTVAAEAAVELQQNMSLPDTGPPKLDGIEGTTRADEVMVGRTILSVSQEFSREVVRGAVRVEALGGAHMSHVRRKLLQRALWGVPLFSERSWWALTMALAVLSGLLLISLMQ